MSQFAVVPYARGTAFDVPLRPFRCLAPMCRNLLSYRMPWGLLARLGFGLLWAALGCFGLLWAALGCSGLLWAALGCSGLLWATLGCFGLLCKTHSLLRCILRLYALGTAFDVPLRPFRCLAPMCRNLLSYRMPCGLLLTSLCGRFIV